MRYDAKNWLQYEQEICDSKPVFCDFYRLQVTLWHQNLFSPNLTLSLPLPFSLSLSLLSLAYVKIIEDLLNAK